MHRAVPHVRTRRSLGHTRILKRDPLVSNACQMSKVMIVTSGLFSGWTVVYFRCILSLLRPLHSCGLQISHLSVSFQQLSLSGCIVSSQSSLFRSLAHVRLGLHLPRLPPSLPSIVLSRVS